MTEQINRLAGMAREAIARGDALGADALMAAIESLCREQGSLSEKRAAAGRAGGRKAQETHAHIRRNLRRGAAEAKANEEDAPEASPKQTPKQTPKQIPEANGFASGSHPPPTPKDINTPPVKEKPPNPLCRKQNVQTDETRKAVPVAVAGQGGRVVTGPWASTPLAVAGQGDMSTWTPDTPITGDAWERANTPGLDPDATPTDRAAGQHITPLGGMIVRLWQRALLAGTGQGQPENNALHRAAGNDNFTGWTLGQLASGMAAYIATPYRSGLSLARFADDPARWVNAANAPPAKAVSAAPERPPLVIDPNHPLLGGGAGGGHV